MYSDQATLHYFGFLEMPTCPEKAKETMIRDAN
jgi:hypothetical protein